MPSPTPPLLDDFNRADGPVGSNYTADPYPLGDPAPVIVGNQAVPAGGAASSAWWNVTQSADVEVSVTVPAWAPSSTEGVLLFVRLMNPGVSGGAFYLCTFLGTGGGGDYQIYRVASGSAPKVAEWGGSAPVAGDTLAVQAIGGTITLWKKHSGLWTSIGAYTDPSPIAGPGYVGFRVNNGVAVDDLSVAFLDVPVGPDTTPPTAPGTLTASALSARHVLLGWGAATDDVGVTHYLVERDGLQVAIVTGLTYNDPVLPVSTHTYRVRASDAAGNLGAYSNTATVTTPAEPPGGLRGTVAALASQIAAGVDLPGLQVAPFWNPTPTPPSIDVYLDTVSGEQVAFDGWERRFVVRARLSTPDDVAAQEVLIDLMDTTGPTSVIAAIRADSTLGGAVGGTAIDEVSGPNEYAGSYLGGEWKVRTIQ